MENVATKDISAFAESALSAGMVYCCAWGQDCERLHDIVDEVIVQDAVFGDKRFVGPDSRDTIMTTWHARHSLKEAVRFFKDAAVPTPGFLADSRFGVVVIVGNPKWGTTAKRVLQRAVFGVND